MPKRALDSAKMLRLVNHGPTVLVSSGHGGRNNIITLAWFMPVSMDPPMLAIAIAPGRYSHGLIMRSREYVINVPPSRLLPAVWYCGTKSGSEGDKFRGAKLTPAPASVVAAPLVEECFAHIECRVIRAPTTGDHTLFLGEAVAASVEEKAFDGHLRLKQPFHTLHHLGGPHFVTSAGTRLSAS